MFAIISSSKNIKVIDLSILPPSQQTLRLHILRSTYVAKLWRPAITNNIEVPDITVHGWTANGQIKWLEHE